MIYGSVFVENFLVQGKLNEETSDADDADRRVMKTFPQRAMVIEQEMNAVTAKAICDSRPGLISFTVLPGLISPIITTSNPSSIRITYICYSTNDLLFKTRCKPENLPTCQLVFAFAAMNYTVIFALNNQEFRG